ncbi:hypothetical protein JW906_13550 [bacterium]|nr:hypothetical protein [bacterium]
MIVKMNKVTLLVSLREREKALLRLRKMGLLHVEAVQTPQSEDLEKLKSEAALADKALGLIGNPEAKAEIVPEGRAAENVSRILDLAREKDSLQARLAEKRAVREWFRRWGDVSWSSMQALGEAGVTVRLYAAPKNILKQVPEGFQIQKLGEEKGVVYLALFADSPEQKLDIREETVPAAEIPELEAEIRGAERALASVESEISKIARTGESIKAYRNALHQKIEFATVVSGMGVEEGFTYVQGYCPKNLSDQVRQAADSEGWGYLIAEPDDPGQVPTLIRNPKWIRIIDPLFKFMGTVPGYGEKDISLWFLLFFSLYFAMIVGDAGYGLVFLGLTLFARKKAGKQAPQEIFRLFTVLSIMTIIWGAASGTWFSLKQVAALPFLKIFVVRQLDSSAGDNSGFIMYLCFVIGLVQLSTAHLINAFQVINSPRALGDIGWIGILSSVFFLAGNLVLGRPMPPFTGKLFMAGVATTLIFSNFQKNIFKGILATLANLPLSILSSFSDLTSYLRLYAVGFAGVTVSTSFNNMLLGSAKGIVSIILAAAVLLLAHALNIVLSGMSVIVHGVRLNLLEFSGHLGMGWTGRTYQPFRE